MDPTAIADRLPILTFHALDDEDRSAIAYSPVGFARALEALQRLTPRALELTEVGARLRSGAGFPARAVVLTFDDGYRSVYDVAFPLLLRYGFSATVFLTVGRGGTGADDRLPSMNGRPMLSWGEIRAMHRAGVTFGAHTLTHPDLTRLPLHRAQEEIWESKARIEDALGAAVTSFAYPFGAADRQSRRVVAERFECACTDRLGLASSRSDPYALERVDACYLRAAPLVEKIFTETFAWYLRARSLPRLIKRALGHPAARGIRRPGPGGSGRSREEVVHGG